MYATSGGALASKQVELKKETPYYTPGQQKPTNTTSDRPGPPARGARPKRGAPVKSVKHAVPRAISDGFLHQMFTTAGGKVNASPAGLAQMTQAQQCRR